MDEQENLKCKFNLNVFTFFEKYFGTRIQQLLKDSELSNDDFGKMFNSGIGVYII